MEKFLFFARRYSFVFLGRFCIAQYYYNIKNTKTCFRTDFVILKRRWKVAIGTAPTFLRGVDFFDFFFFFYRIFRFHFLDFIVPKTSKKKNRQRHVRLSTRRRRRSLVGVHRVQAYVFFLIETYAYNAVNVECNRIRFRHTRSNTRSSLSR